MELISVRKFIVFIYEVCTQAASLKCTLDHCLNFLGKLSMRERARMWDNNITHTQREPELLLHRKPKKLIVSQPLVGIANQSIERQAKSIVRNFTQLTVKPILPCENHTVESD